MAKLMDGPARQPMGVKARWTGSARRDDMSSLTPGHLALPRLRSLGLDRVDELLLG